MHIRCISNHLEGPPLIVSSRAEFDSDANSFLDSPDLPRKALACLKGRTFLCYCNAKFCIPFFRFCNLRRDGSLSVCHYSLELEPGFLIRQLQNTEIYGVLF